MSQRTLAAVLMVLMLLAALAAGVLQPRVRLSEQLGSIKLDDVVPVAFGDWELDRRGPVQVVNPQQQEMLSQIYSQTLSRTYVNKQGYRVMLSIAYGGDQRDAMQVHYPEVCYPAQGFSVNRNTVGSTVTAAGTIPVRRLETSLGRQRLEPVTYWTTVGERAVMGNLNKKAAEMSYGLRGIIPDGMLFRVSSLDAQTAQAFAMQDRFITDIVAALPARHVARFSGLRAVGSAALAPAARLPSGS